MRSRQDVLFNFGSFLPKFGCHGNSLGSLEILDSDENSVRLSVTRVYCDKTEERSVQIFIPYES